jgi:hypothetical protein
VWHLAQDVAEVAELWEEETQARASTVMLGARDARAEKIAQEKAALLGSAHVEVDEAAWKASLLEGELVATRWD